LSCFEFSYGGTLKAAVGQIVGGSLRFLKNPVHNCEEASFFFKHALDHEPQRNEIKIKIRIKIKKMRAMVHGKLSFALAIASGP
jgi:hypothetical protein